MKLLTLTVAATALAASTGLALAQQDLGTPAVSPSMTMTNPGGADGGLAPSDTPSGFVNSNPYIGNNNPYVGTTGMGSRDDVRPRARLLNRPASTAPRVGGSGAQPVNPGRIN